MYTHFRLSVSKRFAKFLNIAALVSLLSSFITFAPMLPARAAALQSLTTTLAQPIFSADWDTDPSYTNVKYVWKQTTAFQASAGDACIAAYPCVRLSLILQDTGVVGDNQMQEWQGSIVSGDIIDEVLPDNATITAVSVLENGLYNGRYERLDVHIDCSAACTFATSSEYSITIVNYPIQNQEAPASYVEGVYSTTTHYFQVMDFTEGAQDPQTLTSVVAVGKGITVTASVDPSLSFSIAGFAAGADFYQDNVDIDNSAAPDTCAFGTLTPTVPKICAWFLYIATNASNGYAIYVVQDHDMEFNGNEIKQFNDGTRVDDSDVDTEWASPSSPQLAHLGYTSSDTSVFPPAGGANAIWAGIPNIADDTEAPIVTGLVADSLAPGVNQYTYAIKVESASTLPQGTGYSHNEYFIVVGNF